MARARRTRVSAPRGTAAATGASAGAASENNFTVPAVPPSSKLSALSDFLLPELVSLRLCAQRAARGQGDARSGAVRRGAERRGAVEWSRDALPAAGEACEGPAAAERASGTHVFGS